MIFGTKGDTEEQDTPKIFNAETLHVCAVKGCSEEACVTRAHGDNTINAVTIPNKERNVVSVGCERN